MNVPLAVCLILSIVVTVIGVAHDTACVSNADCTDPNTYCHPTESPTCAKGKCRCLEYMVWDGTDAKCKVRKYFVDRCNTTLTSCRGGSVCSGVDGQCVCNGITNNYYTALQKCITSATTLKVIGEDCTLVDDCHEEISGSVQCVVPTGNSAGSQKKCQCAAGYVTARNSCRKPHFGETCTAAVQCVMEIDISGVEGSVVTETCSSSSNLCVCPEGSTRQDFKMDGYITNICLSDYTGTALDVGIACTASNECSSKICGQCPEDTAKKCLAVPSS